MIFQDLSYNEDNYGTIFENQTLKSLKNCHEVYGAKFSLYVFYEFNGVKLSECTAKFRSEFEKNSDWLNWGFHALNAKIDYSSVSKEKANQDYKTVINQLKRIVGEKSITTVVRLEKFCGNKENIETFKNCDFGITGLLAADTHDRKNYYLNEEQNNFLFDNDYCYDIFLDIFFCKTDIRIEKLQELQELENVKDDSNLIIFTHEWTFSEQKSNIEQICEWAIKNNYIFEFPSSKNN